MQIYYLWAENFRKIKNQGFNFSSKYQIEYNNEKKELNCKELITHVPDLFCSDDKYTCYVTELNAIIGENGSGKSTLLELISYIFSYTPRIYVKAIAIYEIDNRKYCLCHKDYKINKDIPEKYLGKIEFKTYGFEPNEHIKEFKYIDVIKLSNIFEPFKMFCENANTKDLTTNNLYYQYKKNLIEIGNPLYSKDNYIIYSHEELENQLNFIEYFTTHKIKIIKFTLPESIEISFKSFDQIVKDYKIKKENGNKNKFYSGLFFKCIDKFISNINTKEFCNNYDRIIINLFFSFLNELNLHKDSGVNSHLNHYYIRYRSIFWNETVSNIERIKNFFKDLNNESKTNLKFTSFESNWLACIYNFIFIIYSINTNDELSTNSESVIMEMNKFIKFFSAYKYTFNFYPYLQFKWRNLSSGENTMLTLYSRLFSISDFAIKNDGLIRSPKLQNDLILLIDEGELYMHPEWQRNYLNNILDFSRKILNHNPNTEYEKPRSLHIILTSNSPFIVSDLPKENIIFLQMEDDSITNLPHSAIFDEKENSFGANIHSLLSKSFFMESTMGEFSKIKINTILDFISNSNNANDKDKEIYLKLIHLIGEPIIRGKLVKLFYEKFHETQDFNINEFMRYIENLDDKNIIALKFKMDELLKKKTWMVDKID